MIPQIFVSQVVNDRPRSTESLNEICIRYHLDKADADEHKFEWHKKYPYIHCNGWAKYYEPFMNNIRDKPLRLLEIGICTQLFPFGSVKAWLDFFPRAEIWGLDNFGAGSFPGGTQEALEERRQEIDELMSRGFNLIFADTSDEDCIKSAKLALMDKGINDFDIVIDDGSHRTPDTLICLDSFFDMVKPGGYYAIEDLANAWPTPAIDYFHGDNSEIWHGLISMIALNTEGEKAVILYNYSKKGIALFGKIHKNLKNLSMSTGNDFSNWIAVIQKR